MPAQWDVATRQWLLYMVSVKGGDWWGGLYPPDNMQRPTGQPAMGVIPVDYNIQTKQVAGWNVGCERSNGPGSEHLENQDARRARNPR